MTRYGPRPPVVVVKPNAFIQALDESGLTVRPLAHAAAMPVSTVGAICTAARRAVEDNLPAEDFPHTTLFNARALARALGRQPADLFAEPSVIAGGLR